MAKYYVFIGKDVFCRTSTKIDALQIAGETGLVFRHVDGIPNPWHCWTLDKNGKVDKTKIVTYNKMNKMRNAHFKNLKS